MNWSPLPYPGAKTRAVKHLLPLIPKGVTRVVSPFCGGCSFEIALALSGILVLAFDILPRLVNFWTVLKEAPDILTQRVRLIHGEFGRGCFDRLRSVSCSFNRFNQAATYYALKRAQFNRAESGNYVPGHPRFTENSIRLIQDFRWPDHLHVALNDFRDTLRRYPSDFLYLDPPYYLPSNLYGYPGVEWCHTELAALLRHHKGRFLLCYNDDPYIRSLYSEYLIAEASHLWRYGANKSKRASEIFILNYEPSCEDFIGKRIDTFQTSRRRLTVVSGSWKGTSCPQETSKVEISPYPGAIILAGDCKETLKAVRSESVNLVVSSPPYNMQRKYGTARERSRSLDEYLEEMLPILRELHRVLGPTGSLCWQVGNHVQGREVFPLDIHFYGILKQLGLRLRNRIVWHFEHGVHATRRFSGRYETILWFTKTDDYVFNLDPVRIPAKYPGKKHYKGPRRGKPSCHPLGKNPSDYWDIGSVLKQGWEELVWDIPNVKANHPEKTIHPCQFPIELVQRLVLALTNEGDLVLDPFGGVGSSLIAAVSLNRNAVMCETEEEYIEIARQRLKDYRNGTLRIRPLGKPIHQPTGHEREVQVPEEWGVWPRFRSSPANLEVCLARRPSEAPDHLGSC